MNQHRILTIVGVVTAVAFAIIPELTSLSPLAAKIAMLIGLGAAAVGKSLVSHECAECGSSS
jgi:hypothetical protein